MWLCDSKEEVIFIVTSHLPILPTFFLSPHSLCTTILASLSFSFNYLSLFISRKEDISIESLSLVHIIILVNLPLLSLQNFLLHMQSGWTALMFAAQEAQKDVVEILIENGADTNIDNNVSVSIESCNALG